jgi:hypothetical protein
MYEWKERLGMDAGSYVNLMYVREDREVGGNIQLESKKRSSE